MKRTKRLLSTLLALCMVLAMLPATAMAAGNTEPAKKPVDRYTVLVLDHSGSMRDEPIEQMQSAAKQFCQAAQEDNAKDNKTWNRIAILGFSTTPDTGAVFTDNINDLTAAIDRLQATNLTDIAAALVEADSLLQKVGTSTDEYDVVKNIVLLSDGLPETYENGESGKYDNYGFSVDVGQSNRCWNIVEKSDLRTRNNVYTLGFFHSMSAERMALCRQLLSDIQTKGFYTVTNSNDLEFVLGDLVASDILDPTVPEAPETFDPQQATNKIVVKIACPVNVTVEVKGTEVLNSVSQTDSKYGKIDFTPSTKYPGTNIKTVTLAAGYPYNFELAATAPCKAEVTYTYYDGQGIAKRMDGTPGEGVAQEVDFTISNATDLVSNIYVGANSNRASITEPSTATKDTEITDTSSHFTFVPTVTGGTVVLSKRNAEPGDWVNIYVTPDEGYKLESLTVTDMRGWPVTLREMGENAFSFTMPNARINVNPVFVKVEADDDPYSTNVPTTIPNIEGTSPNYGNMVINTAAMNYSDVNAGDWFYNNVKFCHERYLLNKTGEADGKFEPNTASTRATVWTALSRLAGRNTVTQGDNWYDRAQIWAKGKGITDGERPMDSMTREEFVTMLWRYDGNKYVQNSALGQFNDGESVSWWATEAVKWAVATGLLNGSNGSLNPQSNVTRAEVAAVLQRYVQNVH